MGFVTFSGAANGTGSAADQSKYRTQTTLGFRPRVRGDTFLALGDFQQTRFVQLGPGGRKMFAAFYFEAATGYFVAINDGTSTRFLNIAPNTFTPSSTAWYVVRVGITPSATSARLYDGAGTALYAEATGASATMPSATGDGEITIGDAGTNRVLTMDGIGIYSALLSDTGIDNVPATGDANILGAYLFTEGTGASAADLISGGTALTLSGTYAWGTVGATWPVVGPSITTPAASASLTVEQGGTLSVPVTIVRKGNTNSLTFRTQSGTPPSGVSMANVTIANPATTGTGSLVATGSAPLVTADPMVFELVDGSTVVATVAVTVTVTAAAAPTFGGGAAGGKVVEQNGSARVWMTLRNATTGARLTASTNPLRVAPAGSSAFVSRTATYDSEAGEYYYDLTEGERAVRAVARIIPQAPAADDTIEVAVVEGGTLFSAMSTITQKLATLATGISAVLTAGPFQSAGGELAIATHNAFTGQLPVFLVGTGRTVIGKFCETREGNPAPINAALQITLTEGADLYSETIARTAINTHLTAFIGKLVFWHVDDGVGYHAVQPYLVTDARPLMI